MGTIIMDGMSNEQILKVIHAIKKLEDMPEIIFASTTETSKKWTVEKLIEELKLEHEEMKAINNKKK